MKSNLLSFSFLTPCLAALALAGMPAFTHAAQIKVRVAVKENPGGTTAPEKKEKEKPAPAKTPPNGTKPVPTPTKGDKDKDKDMYTHTKNLSLTVSVGNTTAESMDVTVKVTFLAKDEGGKHEIVTEKTLENKLTLPPSKSADFTTEEVGFTHTSSHRDAPKGGAKAAKVTNIPASGHIYAGYKIEVFAGSDLVGSASSTGGF